MRPSIRKHWCPTLDAVAPTPERLPRATQEAPRGCCHGAFFAGEALAASRPQRAVNAGPPAPRGPHGPPVLVYDGPTPPQTKNHAPRGAVCQEVNPTQVFPIPRRPRGVQRGAVALPDPEEPDQEAPRQARATSEREPSAFLKDFSRPMAIPEEGIAAAVEVMRGGRLFRYCATSAETSHVAQAEKETRPSMVNQARTGR